MSENKRFTMDEDGNITDTVEDRTLYVENLYTECKYFTNLLNELNDENQHLKGVLKELKDIGDYQAMRIQELDDMNRLIEDEIDKKITLLIDAKIQCFQNEDEELLGKINFGIQLLNELQEGMLNE